MTTTVTDKNGVPVALTDTNPILTGNDYPQATAHILASIWDSVLKQVSASLSASELHLGEIGGKLSIVSVEITRENNATLYGIGDVVSGSAATPLVYELPNIMRVAGGTGYVALVAVTMNVKSVTPALRVHFFNASTPTVSGDNLPHQEKYADTAKRLRYVDLPAMTTAADTANSDMSRAVTASNPWLPVQAAAGSRSLWVSLETLTAVQLTALSKTTILVAVDNN